MSELNLTAVFLLLMLLFRSICHEVSNQTDKLALLAIILVVAVAVPFQRRRPLHI